MLWSMGSQTDKTERLNSNNEIEQMQNNFRDKTVKIGYYKQWKKTLKIKLKILNLHDEDDGNAIDRIRHKKEERT